MPTRLRQTVLLAPLAALALATPALARTQDAPTDEPRAETPVEKQVEKPRNYVALHLGLNDLGTRAAKVDFGSNLTLDAEARLKKGMGGGLVGGHAFDHLRVEAELQYGNFKVEGASVGVISFSDKQSGHYTAATLNLLPTLDLAHGLTLFAGGGIGWGQINLPHLTVPIGCSCFDTAKGSGFAYQYRGGLEIGLDRNDFLFGQYSRLNLKDARDRTLPGVDYGRTAIGTIALGYRHGF